MKKGLLLHLVRARKVLLSNCELVMQVKFPSTGEGRRALYVSVLTFVSKICSCGRVL